MSESISVLGGGVWTVSVIGGSVWAVSVLGGVSGVVMY